MAELNCQNCGKLFPRGKARNYVAKYCPECRPAFSVKPKKETVLEVPELVWGTATRENVKQLSLDRIKGYLENPNTPAELVVKIFGIAARWDEDKGGKEVAEAWKKRQLEVVKDG